MLIFKIVKTKDKEIFIFIYYSLALHLKTITNRDNKPFMPISFIQILLSLK